MKLAINIVFSILTILALIKLWNVVSEKVQFGDQFVIEGGNFDLDIQVIITTDTAYALSYVRENLDSSAKSSDFDSRGTTFPSINGNPPIIWLPTAQDVAINNHELLHATIDVMNWASVPFSPDTEEVYAYELQYLSTQLYNHIKP